MDRDALAASAAEAQKARRFEEAAEGYGKMLALDPKDAAALQNLGRCLTALGRLTQALARLNEAKELKPNSASVRRDLAVVYYRQGRIADAISTFQQSIDLDPNSPRGYAGLADIYLNLGNVDAGIECLKKAQALEPNKASGLIKLAQCQFEDGQVEEAEKSIRQAIELEPGSSTALGLLSQVLQAMGRFDEAQEPLQQAIAIDPSPLLYYRWATGRKVGSEDREVVAGLRALLNRRDISQTERALVEYGLGKALDDLGEYEQAIRHFDDANRLELERYESTGRIYDPDRHQEEVRRTIATFTPELFERQAGSSSDTPILIMGMERSGTSLLEQIVSSHPLVGGGGELNFWLGRGLSNQESVLRDPSQLDALCVQYLEVLAVQDKGKLRVTDKMPGNILMAGLIHYAFSKAKILWCLRNPLDNCLSLYFTPIRAGAAYLNSRRNIALAYQRHLELLDHWLSVLPVETFKVVRYEDLVADQERIIRDVIGFLGLEWDDRCLHHQTNTRAVKTPSLWQARQPIYRTSVERWRNYEPWLGDFALIRQI